MRRSRWRTLAVEVTMALVLLGVAAAIVLRTVPGILGASSAAAPSGPHHASLARDGRAAATLAVRTGTPDLTIDLASLGLNGPLLRVTTPAASGPPRLRAARQAGTTVVDLTATRTAAFTVTLNAAVRWTLDLAGGTTRTTAGLRGGKLAAIVISKGSGVIDLTLPAPAGTIPVRLAAGASQLILRLPDGVPARVTAAAGAGRITLAGQTRVGVRAGTVLTAPAWAAAVNRYDIDATAGAGRITVTTAAN